MHKLISPEPDRVAVAELEVPAIERDEVLVKAVRSLISPGSELNRVRRLPGDTDDKWPNHDLGYAMCGEVVELGADVEGFAVGDRVMTMGHHQQFVASSTQPGVTKGTVHLPDELSWDEAPFMIWSRSCANWTMKADIALGETVAIMGLGLVGLLMAMWVRLRGPRRVIGLDLHDLRLDLGLKAGCDEVIRADREDVVQAVNEATDGGAHCTIHCVAGAAVESFELTQRITRGGGRVLNIGHHSKPLTILFREFLGKDLLGGGTDYDRDHKWWHIGADFLAQGRLPVLDIVTHNVPYTGAPAIYDVLNFRPHEAGAVLLWWDV